MVSSKICYLLFPVLLGNLCKLGIHPVSSFIGCAAIHSVKTGEIPGQSPLTSTHLEVNYFPEVLRIFWN